MGWTEVDFVRKIRGGVDINEHHLLLLLATHVDKEGEAFPSTLLLAQEMQYADSRGVRRMIDKLVVKGIIRKEQSKGGVNRNTNVYRFNLNWRPPARACETSLGEGELSSGRRGVGRPGGSWNPKRGVWEPSPGGFGNPPPGGCGYQRKLF